MIFHTHRARACSTDPHQNSFSFSRSSINMDASDPRVLGARAKRVLDMAATDPTGERLEEVIYRWLERKTAGNRQGALKRTGAAFSGTRGDGGRDMEYNTRRGDTVRVDSKVSHSNIGVLRVSAFAGRLEEMPGNVTGLLIAYPADFSADARDWLEKKQASNFLGTHLAHHDAVLISGERLREQIDAMQYLDPRFCDDLTRLEDRWKKVDGVGVASPVPAPSPSSSKRHRDAPPSSPGLRRSNSLDAIGSGNNQPAPKKAMADFVTPFEGMRVWLNLCDQPDDRPAEAGTYEGEIQSIKEGRSQTIAVKINKKIVCARPPAATKAICGPEHPKCANEDNVVTIHSLTVHELWTQDGKRRVAHPFSEALRRELQPQWHGR